MPCDIETLLKQCGLRYTKDSIPGLEDQFSVPFDSTGGPFSLLITVAEETIMISSVLRSLDSLALASEKALFEDLLKINVNSTFARVSLWIAPDEETDWIAVASDVPSESLTAPVLDLAIACTADFAANVLALVANHTAIPQKQLG